MSHNLPPEVLQYIFRHIETIFPLGSCTLVSQEWSSLARPILFRTLTIYEERNHSLANFIDFLQNTASFHRLVHSLEVAKSPTGKFHHNALTLQHIDHYAILEVLGLLPNLQSLTLRHVFLLCQLGTQERLPTRFSLQRLRLDHFAAFQKTTIFDLLRVLGLFDSIQELIVNDLNLTKSEEFETKIFMAQKPVGLPTTVDSLTLRVFAFDDDSGILNKLFHNAVSISQIKEMEVCLPLVGDSETEWESGVLGLQLVQGTKNSIKHLILCFFGMNLLETDVEANWDLGSPDSWSSLDHLSFRLLSYLLFPDELPHGISALPKYLSHFSSPERIRTLSFLFDYAWSESFKTLDASRSDWIRVEEIIMKRFPRLETVEFRVEYTNPRFERGAVESHLEYFGGTFQRFVRGGGSLRVVQEGTQVSRGKNIFDYKNANLDK